MIESNPVPQVIDIARKSVASEDGTVPESTAENESGPLELTKKLLDAIVAQDWDTYASLTDKTLTCFEPEANGNLVEGLEFHKFYFDLPSANSQTNTTMARPHVRVMGNVAIVSYVRLTQRLIEGKPVTSSFEETRVWEKQEDGWKHVHFHRSVRD